MAVEYRLRDTLSGHNGTVRSLVVLDNGFLVSGSDDFSIKIWDNKNGKLIQTFDEKNEGHSNQIRKLIKLKSNHVASISLDRSVKIWNFTRENLIENTNSAIVLTLNSTNGGHNDSVISAELIDDSFYYYLATGSVDKKIIIWDLSNMINIKPKYTLIGHTDLISSLLSLVTYSI